MTRVGDAHERGRAARRIVPRRALAQLETDGRDPLGILSAQNAGRVPELVPLRAERMSASPFAFYRGTAALMAADLAAGPSSGILVASCGDAHVANFGFYASPQRSLVFDLNDFDEAGWAPWEWDLKRLVTSIVIAGQSSARAESVTDAAARGAVRTYARAMSTAVARSPLDRYFQHYEVTGRNKALDKRSRDVVKSAVREAQRRTGERAVRKLTEPGHDGRLRFVETPPTMTHLEPDLAGRVQAATDAYRLTTNADIRLLLQQFTPTDTVRRVVGVGSVGTRCYITVLQDAGGHPLILQVKQAGPSVLVEHGRQEVPPGVAALIDASGEGARVVALQRILQGVSDPFLGHFRGDQGDYYLRQFRDMKVGLDIETLHDAAFHDYAQACAAILARAHSQSPHATEVVGYLGSGRGGGGARLEWAPPTPALSRTDFDAFVSSSAARRSERDQLA